MQARSAEVKMIYAGKDISRDIAPYLTGFTFTDNTGKTADDISFTLEDRKGLWLSDWFPRKGDKVQCSIILNDGASRSLPCGVYEVDQIDYSCPPRVMTVKAVSAKVSAGIRHQSRNQVWENTGLKVIAGDIANRNGLKLYYDAEDVKFEHREQKGESDIVFLSGLCGDYGMTVKVNDGKLIVFDSQKNEEAGSVAELSADDGRIISWKFSSKASGTYRKARVKYHHAAKDEEFEGEAEDEGAEGTGRVLELNVYAESSADAKELAAKKLYEANKGEVSGNISITGDERFRAGVNITLKGFGAYSGKYTVKKAVHALGTGYVTTLELKQGEKSKKKKKKTGEAGESYYTGDRYYGKDRQG